MASAAYEVDLSRQQQVAHPAEVFVRQPHLPAKLQQLDGGLLNKLAFGIGVGHGVCVCWNQNGMSSSSFVGGAIGLAVEAALAGLRLGVATVTAGAAGLGVAAAFGCNHLVN